MKPNYDCSNYVYFIKINYKTHFLNQVLSEKLASTMRLISIIGKEMSYKKFKLKKQ